MGALQALSELARDGNLAAQVLLGQLAQRPASTAHATESLTRAERISLTRAPGGLSGTSWTRVAAQTDPLAAALWQSRRVETRLGAIRSLIALGEYDHALQAAKEALYRGAFLEVIDVLQAASAELPADAAFLQVLAADSAIESGVPGAPSRAATAVARRGVPIAAKYNYVPPAPRAMFEDDALFDAVAEIAPDVRYWRPLRALCENACPSSVNACTAVLGSIVQITAPNQAASPLQSVISNTQYWSSPRIRADMARGTFDVASRLSGLAKRDGCAVTTMIELQARYGSAK